MMIENSILSKLEKVLKNTPASSKNITPHYNVELENNTIVSLSISHYNLKRIPEEVFSFKNLKQLEGAT